MGQETNEIKVGDWVEFKADFSFVFGMGTAQVIELRNSSVQTVRVFFINKHGNEDWVPLEWCTKTNEKSALIKKLFSTLDDEQSEP